MCVLECVLTEDNQEEGHNWLCSQGEVNGLAVYHQSGVSRHLSGALGSLLVNTSSGRATQMDFQINYEARTCWNPPRIFTTLCVHHRRGASLLCTTRRMTTHLICAALILSALMARMCVCVPLRMCRCKRTRVQSATLLISVQQQQQQQQQTVFWQDSSTLHYYAKIIIHPQQRRKC